MFWIETPEEAPVCLCAGTVDTESSRREDIVRLIARVARSLQARNQLASASGRCGRIWKTNGHS